VGDFLPGYESSQWYGVGAPKNTSTDIIDKLNKEINAASCGRQDESQARGPRRHTACRFARRFRQAHRRGNEKWGKVIRAANIKPG